MTSIVELVRLFAEPLEMPVVLTDCMLKTPGPTILYVNPAFVRMSGYDVVDLVGQSPRLLQGPHTDRQAAYALTHGLRTKGQFRGVLQNYRKCGEPYLCELDIRCINSNDGAAQAYIAFEQEIVRRRGRPSKSGMKRYRPININHPTTGIFLQ